MTWQEEQSGGCMAQMGALAASPSTSTKRRTRAVVRVSDTQLLTPRFPINLDPASQGVRNKGPFRLGVQAKDRKARGFFTRLQPSNPAGGALHSALVL